jgi:hypothetical protein
MQTVADNLRRTAETIKTWLGDLLLRHSSIHHEPTKTWESEVPRGPWGHTFRGVSIGYSQWNGLSAEGQQLQARVLKEYRRYAAILQVLMKDQPQSILGRLKESERTVLAAIEQNGSPLGGSPQEVFDSVAQALGEQVALVTNLFDATGAEAVYVPDTNALLYNPQLEDWTFPDAPRFTVVLLPTVLGELDQLKVNHRNEDVRRKAEGLITRLKGYRSRGRLTEGVPLKKGTSDLVTVAEEPDFQASLPWLDPANNDDRALASLVEVMRKYPHSLVVLVTRDINLQNKAEAAGLPFDEPPAVATP